MRDWRLPEAKQPAGGAAATKCMHCFIYSSHSTATRERHGLGIRPAGEPPCALVLSCSAGASAEPQTGLGRPAEDSALQWITSHGLPMPPPSSPPPPPPLQLCRLRDCRRPTSPLHTACGAMQPRLMLRSTRRASVRRCAGQRSDVAASTTACRAPRPPPGNAFPPAVFSPPLRPSSHSARASAPAL